MEQQSNNGQKTAILFLASTILISGILVSGAIISRAQYQDESASGAKRGLQGSGQSQDAGRAIPSCGV